MVPYLILEFAQEVLVDKVQVEGETLLSQCFMPLSSDDCLVEDECLRVVSRRL